MLASCKASSCVVVGCGCLRGLVSSPSTCGALRKTPRRHPQCFAGHTCCCHSCHACVSRGHSCLWFLMRLVFLKSTEVGQDVWDVLVARIMCLMFLIGAFICMSVVRR